MDFLATNFKQLDERENIKNQLKISKRKSDSKTRKYLKNQEKNKKLLERKWLQVLYKTHTDRKSHEQEERPKNHTQQRYPTIFQHKEKSTLWLYQHHSATTLLRAVQGSADMKSTLWI
jgi:hypothetical protein